MINRQSDDERPILRSRALHQRRRRLLTRARTCLGLVAVIAAAALVAAVSATARMPPQQLVAVVLTNHVVRQQPNGRAVYLLQAQRPITGARTVVPVLAERSDSGDKFWLKVRLPGRTSGSSNPPATGWINAVHTQLRTTPWRIVVHLNTRRVMIFYDGRQVREFEAIVGKPSTPTPTGSYFVEEDVTLSQGQAGGPFALATSDRSRVFSSFDGGPGQIAIHGLEGLGGTLGMAESHGCVRIANVNIRWLAAHVGAGTPVTIL
jgi:lipoprotein-anchoring transpeptidase ErfK/SrfK